MGKGEEGSVETFGAAGEFLSGTLNDFIVAGIAKKRRAENIGGSLSEGTTAPLPGSVEEFPVFCF